MPEGTSRDVVTKLLVLGGTGFVGGLVVRRAHGAGAFAYVSSMGARPTARSFYLRMKGTTEWKQNYVDTVEAGRSVSTLHGPHVVHGHRPHASMSSEAKVGVSPGVSLGAGCYNAMEFMVLQMISIPFRSTRFFKIKTVRYVVFRIWIRDTWSFIKTDPPSAAVPGEP